MCVTESYKTIILSPEAWQACFCALHTALRDNRRMLGGLPLHPAFVDYLKSEIALHQEAVDALNAANDLIELIELVPA